METSDPYAPVLEELEGKKLQELVREIHRANRAANHTFSYICPVCQRKQTSVIVNAMHRFEADYSSMLFNRTGGECFVSFRCPQCLLTFNDVKGVAILDPAELVDFFEKQGWLVDE